MTYAFYNQNKMNKSNSNHESSPLPNNAGGNLSSQLTKFLDPNFSANEYTKEAVFTGGVQLEQFFQELSQNQEVVEKAISLLVAEHSNELITTLENVSSIKKETNSIKNDIASLDISLARISIKEPLERLRNATKRLKNINEANTVLKNLSNFLSGKKKLKQTLSQLGQSTEVARDLAKAAQIQNELEELLLPESNLLRIKLVEESIPLVRESGGKIRAEVQKTLEAATIALAQAEIGYCLQAFHNLDCLQERVSLLASFAASSFSQEVKKSLNLHSINEEVNTKRKAANLEPVFSDYVGSKPTSALQAESWTACLNLRMDSLLERSLRSWASKMWNFQKVLNKKRDGATHVLLSEAAFGSVENIHSVAFDEFWHMATSQLESEIKSAPKWIREALTGDFPRIRKSGQSLLKRFWRTVDGSGIVNQAKYSEQLMLAMHPLLGEYLGKLLLRVNEPVHAMFPEQIKGMKHIEARAKGLPTFTDVSTFATVLKREIKSALGDVELEQAVLKTSVAAVSLFAEKAESLVVKTDAARYFKLVPPDLQFSTQMAAAVPSGARSGAEEHNVALLGVCLSLFDRLREIQREVDMARALQSEADEFAEAERPVQKSSGLVGGEKVLVLLAQSILEDYVLSESCLSAFDEVLSGVNAENFMLSEEEARKGLDHFASLPRIRRAFKSFREEHLLLLFPAEKNTPSVEEVLKPSVALLLRRIVRLFSLRAALVRPISAAGRLVLIAYVDEMHTLLHEVCSELDLDKDGAMLRSLAGVKKLVKGDEAVSGLIRAGLVDLHVGLLHFFAYCPPSIHSPFTKANKTLNAYVKELLRATGLEPKLLDQAVLGVAKECFAQKNVSPDLAEEYKAILNCT